MEFKIFLRNEYLGVLELETTDCHKKVIIHHGGHSEQVFKFKVVTNMSLLKKAEY